MWTVGAEVHRAAGALWRRWPTTALAAVALAAGVGVATPLMLYVDHALFRMSPIMELGSLGVGRLIDSTDGEVLLHPRHVEVLRDILNGNPGIAAFVGPGLAPIDDGDSGDPVFWCTLESRGLRMLGVGPAIGRLYTPAEERSGEAVAVISYRLWRTAFGESASALGRYVGSGDGRRFRIVGVMPRGLRFPEPAADVWVPFSRELASAENLRMASLLVRLRPGSARESARTRLQGAVRALFGPRAPRVVFVPLDQVLLARSRRVAPLLVFSAFAALLLAGGVMLYALLSEALRSRPEIGARLMLGSSRCRALCTLPIQGVAIALMGAGPGIAVGWLLPRLHRISIADASRVLPGSGDLGTAASIVGVSVLVGGVAGGVASIGLWRSRIPTLLIDARFGPSRVRRVTSQVLMTGQAAVATAFLACAMLTWVSAVNLGHLSPGFRTGRILTARVTLDAYRTPITQQAIGAWAEFFVTLVDAAMRLPGVESAAATSALPMLGGGGRVPFSVGPARPGCESAWIRGVSDGYFATLGLPFREGRSFVSSERSLATPVAVVNGALARSCWAGTSAVGRTAVLINQNVTIVGVVGDIPMFGLRRPPVPEVYVPLRVLSLYSMSMVLRTSGDDPPTVAPLLRRLVVSLHPGARVSAVRSVDELLADAEAPLALGAQLLGAAATCTVLIALLGVYSSSVLLARQARRERAIRLVLGATPSALRRRAAVSAVLWVALGVLMGAFLARAVAASLAPVLFGVDPFEPRIYAASACSLLACATVAAWIGGRDVVSVDIMERLQSEC